MTLTESRDPCVAQTAPTFVTGRKWTPTAATQQAKSDLRHRDIIGLVQQGRGGLGLGEGRPSWKRAAPAQCRRLVWSAAARAGHKVCKGCLTSQARTVDEMGGSWEFSWRELMGLEAFHTSLILQATYDVLSTHSNLNQWYGEDPTCSLCPSPANLKHILVGCKTSLSQGRYTWRYNHVLKTRRTKINALPPPSFYPASARGFIREGAKPAKVHTTSDISQLRGSCDCKLVVADLNQRLCFPSEIATTNLRRRPRALVLHTSHRLHHRAHCHLRGCCGGRLRT